MTPEELKTRLRTWATEVVVFCGTVRARPEARHIADQLLASATSTSANYRSACRARSRREFIAKLGVAVEEADESVGWLEILTEARLSAGPDVKAMLCEGRQLLAILAASRQTAARNGRPGAGRDAV
jgi:four helix bundle protein